MFDHYLEVYDPNQVNENMNRSLANAFHLLYLMGKHIQEMYAIIHSYYHFY